MLQTAVDTIKRWSVSITAIALVAVAVVSFWKLESNQEAIQEEAVARQVSDCHSSNEFRRLFANYLVRTGEAGLSLEGVFSVDGFSQLDPEEQEFVRGLVALAGEASAASRSTLETYVKEFPVQDCARKEAELRKALR